MSGTVYEWRGRWWCEFKRHPKLGRVRESFDGSADGEKQARALHAHINAYGAFPEGFREAPGVDIGRTWKAAHEHLTAAGGPDGAWRHKPQHRSNKDNMTFIAAHKLGRTPVKRITYPVLLEFVGELAKKRGKKAGSKMASESINRYLSAVSTVLDHACKIGWLDGMPVIPWQQKSTWYQPIYTETQRDAVCAVLKQMGPEGEVAAFLCRVYEQTGMRANELLKVRADQIDDKFILMMDPNKIKNKLPRAVYIGKKWADHLRVLVTSGRMPDYYSLWSIVTKAVKICGYDIPRPIYAFRHTAASRVVGEVHDIQEAQELLGHRSASTTARYRKLSDTYLRKRAEELAHKRGLDDDDIIPAPVISLRK